VGFLLRRRQDRPSDPICQGTFQPIQPYIMKGLNFWQWLGIGLLVLGAIMLFIRKTENPMPGNNPAPGTQTAPTTDRTLR